MINLFTHIDKCLLKWIWFNTNRRIRVLSPRLPVRPGSIRPGSFRPGKWVDSPPLNRYYIIIDEVFFDNFWEIIYLLVVCKKNNNSFIFVYFKYLFISCTYKKNNNSFILVYFCQRSQVKLFLQNLQKQHTRTVKRLFFLAHLAIGHVSFCHG